MYQCFYRNCLWLLVAAMGFFSCNSTPRVVSKSELLKYIQKPGNGLTHTREANGFNIQLVYQPASLLIGRELQESGKGDSATLHELEKKYQNYYYFTVRLSRNGQEAIRQLGSFARYSSMVQVLSFQMDQFVNLTTNLHDTIPLTDFLFEQTYGMSTSNNVLLGFSKAALGKSDRMDVNIGEFGLGAGVMQFPFRREDLEQVPVLNYGTFRD